MAHQEEYVAAIDADVDASLDNMSQAQKELTKYYRWMRSNRKIIVISFIVITIIILLYGALK